MMRRREVIKLVGGAAAGLPLAAQAQQPAMKRIGMLIPYGQSDTEAQTQVAAFLEELQRLGWTDGRNVQVHTRWGDGDGRIGTSVKALVALQPDVILARSTAVTAAFLKETRTIPIVFVIVSDPVGDGFVATMSHPGGNATGFTNVEGSLGSKWLELLKEITPSTSHVAVVFGRQTSPGGGSYYLGLIQNTAASIAVKVTAIPVQGAAEIEATINAFAHEPNRALIVTPDLTTSSHRELIVAVAARSRLPAIYPFPYVVREGGLISYGIDATDIYRRAATYVDRILRGERPEQLAVQAPVKFQLAINLKTAKALGLDVPPTLLARADEVIE
jgi:putative ABC transport system substrate-binding protein